MGDTHAEPVCICVIDEKWDADLGALIDFIPQAVV